MTVLIWVALALALLPALLFIQNRRLFRAPAPIRGRLKSPVSVLIPARNEEASIGKALDAILASENIEFEVIVLDDHSTDATATIVQELARRNSRIRLEYAPELPAGWAGKQHACWTLSQLARYDVFCFLDADVRLTPNALAIAVQFLEDSGASLVSGFPRQDTKTWLECLIIPLMQWLVVCYLPIGSMRRTKFVGLGAGCGQWFLVKRQAAVTVGGHQAVKASFHDGVKLPRAFRAKGYSTDIFDATKLATCRMYTSAHQVWFGLAKNAREGLGGPTLIWIWTLLLLGGHVLPILLLLKLSLLPVPLSPSALPALVLACVLSFGPRLACAKRYEASWWGAVFHPLGILFLLAIQWYALCLSFVGKPIGWKGRPQPRLSSQ